MTTLLKFIIMKNLIILILVFSFSFCYGQRGLWKFSKSELIGYGAMVISGSAKGIHEAVNYHGLGKGAGWWDIKTSWKNKYADYDAGNKNSRYPFSKNLLVIGTDANHCFGFFNTTALVAGTYFISADLKSELKTIRKKDRIWFILIHKIIVPFGLRSLVFETVYKNL